MPDSGPYSLLIKAEMQEEEDRLLAVEAGPALTRARSKLYDSVGHASHVSPFASCRRTAGSRTGDDSTNEAAMTRVSPCVLQPPLHDAEIASVSPVTAALFKTKSSSPNVAAAPATTTRPACEGAGAVPSVLPTDTRVGPPGVSPQPVAVGKTRTRRARHKELAAYHSWSLPAG